MKKGKIEAVRSQEVFNGKVKCLLTDLTTIVKIPVVDKPKDGMTVYYTEHKKGDEYKDFQGKVQGKYENDYNKYEFLASGISNAKKEELTFINSLSTSDEA